MACKHKFYSYLHLRKLDFEPETLMIGTFNPAWPKDNYALWFYGRTNNNYFWDVLPRMFNQPSLRKDGGPKEWKSFCTQNKVAITDFIAAIPDADEKNEQHYEIISKFRDAEFADMFNGFERTGIVDLLRNYPSIRSVYCTRQAGVKLFDEEIRHIKEYCNRNAIYFSYLLTPSANARFQMRGYEPTDPSLKRSLANFIYEKWLERWK